MSPIRQLRWLALLLSAACSAPVAPGGDPPPREAPPSERAPSKASFAIVTLTRTLVYDDHAAAGGKLPDIDLDMMRVVLDYGARVPDTLPVVRTYTVTVAVPSDHPRSWHINLGEDYELLIATRGFTADAKGIKVDGRVKSNYQLQLDEGKAAIGPNSFGFAVQAVGERGVVQVMHDEAPGRIFHEFDETVIEEITNTPPDLPTVGIDESEDAQQHRWSEWTAIRKRGLR
jgi:hypothetical protein